MRAILMSLAAVTAGAANIGATNAPSGAGDSEPGLVVVPPLQVPIVDGGHIQGLLTAKLVIECDLDSSEAIDAATPQLRAALLRATSEFARLHASPYTAVDVAALGAELSLAARRELPEITRVLIVEAAARPA